MACAIERDGELEKRGIASALVPDPSKSLSLSSDHPCLNACPRSGAALSLDIRPSRSYPILHYKMMLVTPDVSQSDTFHYHYLPRRSPRSPRSPLASHYTLTYPHDVYPLYYFNYGCYARRSRP